MKKKYISMLLAGCLAVSTMPVSTIFAAEQPTTVMEGTESQDKTQAEQSETADGEKQPEDSESAPKTDTTEIPEDDSQSAATGMSNSENQSEESGATGTKENITDQDTQETEKNSEDSEDATAPSPFQSQALGDNETPVIPVGENGKWIRSGERWWYRHTDGSYTKNNWEEIKDKWYYFDKDGWMVTGWLHRPSGWYYLMPGSGAMAVGWTKVGSAWYYMNASGTMLADTWIGNDYVDASGKWIQGKTRSGWIQSGKRWWYRHADGSYTKNGWEKIKEQWYYFDKDGWMITGWLSRSGSWYYLSESGAMVTGWKYIDNKWYYLNTPNGNMAVGWKQIGNQWYYFQAGGAMATNTWIGDNYVNSSGVWEQARWVQSGSRWWYRNPDGTYPKSSWKTIGGKEYYFDKDGWMVTGWLKIGSTWYYLNPSGARAYDQWIGKEKSIGSCYISKYGRAVVDSTYSLGDYIYTFDKNGYCTKIENRYSYATDSKNGKTYKVEKSYDTDAKDMSEDDFLAAAVYAEAANQGLNGMTGVAMVMLNRMADSYYPNDARIMIYQAGQFEVARDGALVKAINKLNSSEAAMQNAKAAVKQAREIYAARAKDGTIVPIEGLEVPEGHTMFEYMGFMTPAAFTNANLDPVKTASFTYMQTTFYTEWIKKA